MSLPESQAEVAAFLSRLTGAVPVETHISAVFLGADVAYKLKKSVHLSFLDFSTLAAREHFCRREYALNAPAAPGLYRDVVAVVRRPDGGLALGAPGEVLDWVVRMARVPAEDFLDRIAARGGLTPALLDAVADAVADYHAALAPRRDLDHAAALGAIVAGNVVAARAAALPEPSVVHWEHAIRALIDARAPRLAARVAAGFVRRAHGDLHLGNLCLWQGRPVPFDALEFDEQLAVIDLGYDLAFLLMDLEHDDRRRNRRRSESCDQTESWSGMAERRRCHPALEHSAGRAAANRVLNRYLARTGDWDLPGLLPIFLSLRAMVRAHIQAVRGMSADAAAYLAAAAAYLAPPPPCILALGGLPGAGKSTLARALAPGLGAAPGAVIVRSDEIRKRQHGVPPEQRLPESAYGAAAHRAVADELLDAAGRVAAGGHAVIADATFLDPSLRAALADRAAALGLKFAGAWLDAPLAVLEARVAARAGDASDADLAVLRRAAATDPGPGDWRVVAAEQADAAIAALRAMLPAGAGT